MEASLDLLAGQRLMVGFEGTRIDDELRSLVSELHLGGVILFRRNLRTPRQIRALCRDLQRHAAACGLPPLLIAVDQEGGCVTRLPPPYRRFGGNPTLQEASLAAEFARTTAADLRLAGFNMNMAPVLDVLPPEGKSVMAGRAFGSDPERAAQLGRVVIAGLQADRIAAVAKHFPGIGRTVLDSHRDLPRLQCDLQALAAADLRPFEAAVAEGVAGVMLSHVVYAGVDERWPASLSKTIARDLLRGRLGFGGVTITDDLDMGAVARHFDIDTVAERVLAAEIDIALICHSRQKMTAAFEGIRRRLAASAALRRSAAASHQRLMRLKTRFASVPPGPTA